MEFCQRLLYDKFKWLKNDIFAIPWGITPENQLMERSRDSSDVKAPIFTGIFLWRWLLDRFKNIKPWRRVSSSGISPDNFLLERSMPARRPRVFLDSYSTSFITSVAESVSPHNIMFIMKRKGRTWIWLFDHAAEITKASGNGCREIVVSQVQDLKGIKVAEFKRNTSIELIWMKDKNH